MCKHSTSIGNFSLIFEDFTIRVNLFFKCYQLMWNACKHFTSIGNISNYLISFCLNNQRKVWKVTNWCGMLASIPHRLVTFQNFHWWKGNVKCFQLMWNVLVSIPHQLVTSPIFLWLTWKNDILKCYQLMWNACKHSTSIGNISKCRYR